MKKTLSENFGSLDSTLIDDLFYKFETLEKRVENLEKENIGTTNSLYELECKLDSSTNYSGETYKMGAFKKINNRQTNYVDQSVKALDELEEYNDGKKEKWNRGLDILIESVLKPDPQLRQCAHNQKCYHELMDARESVISHLRSMRWE